MNLTPKKINSILLFILIATAFNFNRLIAQPTFNWAKQIGDTTSQFAISISVDSNGNSYILGQFAGTLDFDPSAATANLTASTAGWYANIYICKLDVSGNFVWAKRIGGNTSSYAYGIALKIDHNNDIYITGRFENTVDFDPGAGIFNLINSSGNDGIFVCKLNSSGNFLWAKSAIGTGSINATNTPFGIDVDSNNNVFVTGNFTYTLDFGSGNTISSTTLDLFIFKLDATGNFVWAKTPNTINTIVGGYGPYNIGYSINIDLNDNVLVTGYFRGTIDFDFGPSVFNLTSLASVPDVDLFVLKLNNNGNFIWAKRIGNASNRVGGIDITSDILNNVIVTGYFQGGLLDMDPGIGVSNLTSGGYYNSFLLKLDFNGNYIWAKNIAENCSQVEAFNVCTDGCGNIYTIGRFMCSADFDPSTSTFNMTPVGLQDVFISKLDGLGNFVWAGQFGPGSTFSFKGNDIYVDNTYDIYFTGGIGIGTSISSPPSDFDPSAAVFNLTTVGYNDIFVSKLTGNPPTVTITGSNTICSGAGTTLTASGATSYSWSSSIGLSITTGSIVAANPTVTTTYTIIGTSGSCTNTAIQTITVNPLPVANAGINQTICEGQSVNLNGTGGSTYSWSTGQTTSNISVSPTSTNIYTLTVSNGSCSNSDTVMVIVNSTPYVSVSNDVTITQGTSTTLTASGGGTYNWLPPPDLSCSNCATTTATPLFSTQYCVNVTFTNGCINSKCINITVDIKCGELFVPNGFSPNGDSKNDVLEVYINKTCITDFSFFIFDRWGEKVFESTDINISWDGTYKGKALDNAVFVYYLKTTLINTDAPIIQKGNVSIIK